MDRCKARLLIFSLVVGLVQSAGCEKRPDSPETPAAGAKTPVAADSASAKASAAAVAGGLPTAQEVLDKMAAAYRNAPSYEDFGTLEFRTDPTQERSDTRVNYSVTLQRPNKLRVEFFNGKVICDGKQWCAFCETAPGQAVLREAPPKLSLDLLRADYFLYSALSDGDQVTSPQLQLLLEKDPIKGLVGGSQEVALDEPGRLGDYNCYRVRVGLQDGPEYLWIDQKTFALRMMVVPIAIGSGPSSGQPQANRMWLTINFERARLGGDIDPKAFQFDIAQGVRTMRALVPTGPYELVGQKLPEFKFVDLQGKPWSSQALGGKPALVYLWRTDAAEGDPMIPAIEQLRAKYKDNDKVSFLAVSLDNPEMPAKTIEDAGKQLKLNVPLLRDNGFEARNRLKVIGPPTTLFIDAKGVLQDCVLGINPVTAAAAPRKFEQVVAGEDIARRSLDEFRQQTREYEKGVDLQFSGETQTATIQQAKPAPAAAKSEPAKLRLKSLWKCDGVRPAGNILVTEEADKTPRIYVVDGFKSVTEIGTDGKVIANHKAKIADKEFFLSLRSAVGRDGKRYFAAFAPSEQRFHLFDEKLQYLLSYPNDALENRHAGLGDVQLGDLSGDGVLKVYVGFAGTVGVKCVSLEGTLIWSCRNLFNVGNVVPGPANAQGQADLFCVNDASSVAIVDAKGQLRDAARLVAEGTLRSLVRAEAPGNGGTPWCGVMFAADPQQTSGQFTAIGLNPSGEIKWRYPLPAGTQQPVESVVAGRLLPGAAQQWLLPGSDGSIHVVALDGAPIDRFNYGEQVTGLATVQIDGKPVLLISSANGVEALRCE